MSAAAAAAGVNISAVTRRPVGGATALSGNTVVVTPGGARWSAGGGGKGVAAAGVDAFTGVVRARNRNVRRRRRLDAAPRRLLRPPTLTPARFCPLCAPWPWSLPAPAPVDFVIANRPVTADDRRRPTPATRWPVGSKIRFRFRRFERVVARVRMRAQVTASVGVLYEANPWDRFGSHAWDPWDRGDPKWDPK